jgi:hypothetical protein
MIYLKTKQKSQFGENFQGYILKNVDIFYGHLEYFTDICTYEIFYNLLVYFVFIWYIFYCFGILAPRKIWQPFCQRVEILPLDEIKENCDPTRDQCYDFSNIFAENSGSKHC